MKKILGFLTILAFIFSCGNNITKNESMPDSNNNEKNRTSITVVNEDFDMFYQRFHDDTSFQLKRIKFPVNGGYTDFDTTINWTSINWEYLKFTSEHIDTSIYNIKFERKRTKVIEQVNCKDCGFSFEMIFNLIGTKWYLTHREDNNY